MTDKKQPTTCNCPKKEPRKEDKKVCDKCNGAIVK